MGCDIHLHVEVKHREKGWMHYNHPRVERMYALFTKMAGVRASDELDIKSLSPPKGVPDDISEMTRLCLERWEGDGHSHSWLGRLEIHELERWYREDYPWGKENVHGLEGVICYLFGNALGPERFDSRSYPEWLEDVRLVFWFDN